MSNLPPQSNEPDHFPFELYTMQFSLKLCHYSTPTLSGVFPRIYIWLPVPLKNTFEELQRYVTGSQPSSFLSRISCTGPLRHSWSAFLLRQTCTFSHIQPDLPTNPLRIRSALTNSWSRCVRNSITCPLSSSQPRFVLKKIGCI